PAPARRRISSQQNMPVVSGQNTLAFDLSAGSMADLMSPLAKNAPAPAGKPSGAPMPAFGVSPAPLASPPPQMGPSAMSPAPMPGFAQGAAAVPTPPPPTTASGFAPISKPQSTPVTAGPSPSVIPSQPAPRPAQPAMPPPAMPSAHDGSTLFLPSLSSVPPGV